MRIWGHAYSTGDASQGIPVVPFLWRSACLACLFLLLTLIPHPGWCDSTFLTTRTINCKVVDFEGAPISDAHITVETITSIIPQRGVRVRMGDDTSSTKTSILTDSSGNCHFIADRRNSLHLFLEHEGYCPIDIDNYSYQRYTVINNPGDYAQDHIQLGFCMKKATTVSGIIVDSKNLPVSGAAVAIAPVYSIPQGAPSERTTTTLTSEDGRFIFDSVTSQPYYLTVSKASISTHTEIINGDAFGQEIIHLSDIVTSVSGFAKLLPGNERITSGVRVTLYPRFRVPRPAIADSNAFRQSTWSANQLPLTGSKPIDSKGHYEFTGLEPGSWSLYIQLANSFPYKILSGESSFKLSARAPTRYQNLLFYKGHTISGRVVESGTKRPVPNATVVLTADYQKKSSCVTNSHGMFQFNNVTSNQRSVELSATHPGFSPVHNPNDYSGNPLRPIRLNLSTKNLHATVTIPLLRDRELSGSVVDANTSQPVMGAEIRVVSSNPTDANAKPPTVFTDQSGEFRVSSPAQFPIRLRAQSKGYSLAVTQSIRLNDRDVSGVLILMRPGSNVSGVVLDPAGKPAPDADVSAQLMLQGSTISYSENNTFSENLMHTSTDAAGNFEFKNLPSQGVTISASKKGFAKAQTVPVSPATSDKATTVELKLREAVSLTGVVTKDGSPAQMGSLIQAKTPSGEASPYVQLDKSGHFIITGIPKTPTVNVCISSGRQYYFYDIATGSKPVELHLDDQHQDYTRYYSRIGTGDKDRLKNGATMHGTVVDYQTNSPIADYIVKASAGLLVDYDENVPGQFTVKGLSVGIPFQTIRIESPNYAPYNSDDITVQSGIKDFNRTFKIGPGGSIKGIVVDQQTKAPVPGVIISVAYPMGGYVASKPDLSTATDSKGSFLLKGVGQGPQSVTIAPPANLGYTKISREVYIVYNEITDAGTIEVGAGGGIKGKLVRMPGSEPIPDAHISISPSSSANPDVVTISDGTFEFKNLPAGLYMIEARAYAANSWVGIEELGVKEVTLEVGSGRLSGRVTQAGNAAAASVKVIKLGFGQSVARMANTDGDGNYLISDLAPGRWEVNLVSLKNSLLTLHDFVTMPETGESVEKNFSFPAGSLVVTVLDAAGKPAPNVQVRARQQAGLEATLQPDARIATTNSNGEARLANLTPGQYTATAEGPQSTRADAEGVNIPADGEGRVTLTLTPGAGGTLVSTAINYESGKPVPTAWCYLFRKDGSLFEHSAQRDELGVMTIPGIEPGDYTMEVSAFGYSISRKPVTIESGQTRSETDVLYPSGALRWALKFSDGSPAAGVPCRLMPSDTTSVEQPREGKSNSDGVYSERGLLPGTYTAIANAPGKAELRQQVQIYAANATDAIGAIP